MTSGISSPRAVPERPKAPSVRARQAAAFGIGAVVYLLWTGVDGQRFRWTPFVIGLVYLAAAVLGGRRGGHWATGCVLTAWGASVLLYDELATSVGPGVFYAVGLAVGAGVAAALWRRGFSAAPQGIIGAVAGALIFLELEPRATVLGETTLYAGLLAAVAAVNLALAVRRP